MALIGTPTTSMGGNTAVSTASSWAGLGRRMPIPAKLTGFSTFVEVKRSGAKILVPGQYETTFNFSVQTTDTTTAIQIRGNASGADGAKVPLDYSAPSTGDVINGSYTFFSNVTAADLSGSVYIVIESASAAGTENIVWLHSQMSVQRIGNAI